MTIEKDKIYATFSGAKYRIIFKGNINDYSIQCGWGSRPKVEGVYVERLNIRKGIHLFYELREFEKMIYEEIKNKKS